MHDHPAEWPLNGGRDAALGHCENRLGELGIELRLRLGAQIDVLVLQSALARDRQEIRAGLDAGCGGVSRRLVGKRDLLDVARLGFLVTRLARIELLLDVRVRDLDLAGDLIGADLDVIESAEFRGTEFGRMGLMIGLEIRHGRIGDLADFLGRDHEILRDPLFAGVIVKQPREPGRRDDAIDRCVDQLAARDGLRRSSHEALRREPVVLHRAQENVLVERAACADEILVVRDLVVDRRLRSREPKRLALLVQRGLADRHVEDIAVEPDGFGLIHGDLGLSLGREGADLVPELPIVIGGRYLRTADIGDHGIAAAAENVGDSPQCERQDQNPDNRGCDPGF